jgi:hypothetical protein
MGKFIQISETCRCCGKTVVFNVTEEAYNIYKNGTPVEEAFPEVSQECLDVLNFGLCVSCMDKNFQGY